MRRLLALVLLAGGACTHQQSSIVTSQSDQVDGARVAHMAAQSGLASGPATGTEVPTDGTALVGPLEPSSLSLVAALPSIRNLHVEALHSPSDTAAVSLREDDHFTDRWGRLMIPAERKIFVRFAADPALGDWLVVEDDVRVSKGPDPIPLTGYRWSRADVESYARCGIPPAVIDSCTQAFYATPEMWYGAANSSRNLGA